MRTTLLAAFAALSFALAACSGCSGGGTGQSPAGAKEKKAKKAINVPADAYALLIEKDSGFDAFDGKLVSREIEKAFQTANHPVKVCLVPKAPSGAAKPGLGFIHVRLSLRNAPTEQGPVPKDLSAEIRGQTWNGSGPWDGVKKFGASRMVPMSIEGKDAYKMFSSMTFEGVIRDLCEAIITSEGIRAPSEKAAESSETLGISERRVDYPNGNHAIVLELDGELYADEQARALVKALERNIDAGHSLLVLDCLNLRSISDTAQGHLINFIDPLEKAGGKLFTARVQPQVKRQIVPGIELVLNVVDQIPE